MPTPDRLGCRPSRGSSVWNRAILGCSIITVDTFVIDGNRAQNKCGGAGAWQQQWSNDVAAFTPDVVVVQAGAWDLFDVAGPDGAVMHPGDPIWTTGYTRDVEMLFDTLSAKGAAIVAVRPPCYGENEVVGGSATPAIRLDAATDQRRRGSVGTRRAALVASVCWISTRPCARAGSRTDRYVPMARTTATTARIAPRRSWPRQFERPRQPKRSPVVDMKRPARRSRGRAPSCSSCPSPRRRAAVMDPVRVPFRRPRRRPCLRRSRPPLLPSRRSRTSARYLDPPNVADTTFRWYIHPANSEVHVLVGVRRQAGPGPHPGILLVPASGGLNTDYVAFADRLAARGFDVAVGCWFASSTCRIR